LEVSGKPAYLWLWYADGTAMPDYAPNCSNLPPPPAYQCNFGQSPSASLADCQQQVQTYLDDWYQDFNLVFTLTRPPSDDYYTVAITSGWPACAANAAELTGGLSTSEGGIAPMNCLDNRNQTAVAIQCGTDAHDCATIIAHEHGHLVGLVHTTSTTSVMNPSIQSTAAGFPDLSAPAVQDLANECNASTQNSYYAMLMALGAWPGGAKPSLFPSSDAAVDAKPADSVDAALQSTADASAGEPINLPGQESSSEGSIVVVAGFDALARTAPPLPGAALPSATTPQSPSGGCSITHGHGAPPTFATLAALCACLGLRRVGRLARGAVGSKRSA
jgi:hypothetical protein